MKRKIILSVALSLLFLVSLSFVIYPLLSNYLADRRQDRLVLEYAEVVETAQEKIIQQSLEAAKAYNAMLSEGQYFDIEYVDLLNQTGSGMMGIISIPSIQVQLPIYHGNQSLELGAVHLEGTSLPVGGESTHSVISAHSGLASEKMFTDLEQLEIGDCFVLSVLGNKLTYEVDQILTVLPHETDSLTISPGQDYCTLLTCTPYGINSHRLLVRGARILSSAESQASESRGPEIPSDSVMAKESTWTREYLRGIGSGLAIVTLISVVAVLARSCKKKRRANEPF